MKNDIFVTDCSVWPPMPEMDYIEEYSFKGVGLSVGIILSACVLIPSLIWAVLMA